MRKVFGLTVMFGILALSLSLRPSSALTPAQESCLRDCLGTYHGCSLGCAATMSPGCQSRCDANYAACRQACLS